MAEEVRNVRLVLGSLLALVLLASGAPSTEATEDDLHVVGIVLDPAGKPLPSVQVLAYGATTLADFASRRTKDPTLDLPRPDGTGTTGADGRFRIPTKTAGLHALRVDPPGTARAVLGGVPAGRGSVPSVVVRTETPTSLEGHLVDPRGKPLAGARVSVLAGCGNSYSDLADYTLRTYVVESDASGRWVVTGARPDGGGVVTIRPHPAGPLWFRYFLGSTEGKGPTQLGGTASARFRLVDPDGRPVAGKIAADVMTEGAQAWFLVSTGADGIAVVEGLPTGKMSIPIAASSEMRTPEVGLRAAFMTTFELVDGKVLDQEVRLAPTRVLEGIVTDDQGHPIAGAIVRPPQDDLELPTATSDAAGRFQLRNVRHWDMVEASAQGYLTSRARPASDAPTAGSEGLVILRLTRFGEVAGRVLTPDGKPAVGWIVAAEGAGGGLEHVMTYTVSGEDGRFLYPIAADGSFVLTTSGPEAFGETTATVVAGKRTEGAIIRTRSP